jgi:hypothetical protein
MRIGSQDDVPRDLTLARFVEADDYGAIRAHESGRGGFLQECPCLCCERR